ncbi:MAG TPA: hAT transposon family protein [Chlamydiales bacterium]|nr:hAT transposon family protein [Chlamydiales bacterium]
MLDPRINYRRLTQDYKAELEIMNEIEARKKELLDYYSNHYAGKAPKNKDADPMSSSSNLATEPPNIDFMARYDVDDEDGTHNELEDYFQLPSEKFRTCDPFDWWSYRKTQFPNLCRLARDILSIPGKLALYNFGYSQTGFSVKVQRWQWNEFFQEVAILSPFAEQL